jgi:hypothetical protein
VTSRLIDLLCDRHRQLVLDARTWATSDCFHCAKADSSEVAIFPGVDSREEMAVHEAGHAYAYLRVGIQVECVDLGGNERFAAYTNAFGHDQSGLAGLTGLWAGPAATRVWLDRLGLLDDAASVDIAMSSRTDTRVVIEKARDHGLIAEACDLADRLMDRHFAAIERVADALLVRGRLSGEEIAALAQLP